MRTKKRPNKDTEDKIAKALQELEDLESELIERLDQIRDKFRKIVGLVDPFD